MSSGLKHAVQKYLGGMLFDRITVPLIKSGVRLPPITSAAALVVETVGRRSGRVRRTPLGYLEVDRRLLWVVAERGERADWVLNARAAGSRATVWVGGESHPAEVEVLPDEDPEEVLGQMASRLIAFTVRLLAHEAKVVELRLAPVVSTGAADAT